MKKTLAFCIAASFVLLFSPSASWAGTLFVSGQVQFKVPGGELTPARYAKVLLRYRNEGRNYPRAVTYCNEAGEFQLELQRPYQGEFVTEVFAENGVSQIMDVRGTVYSSVFPMGSYRPNNRRILFNDQTFIIADGEWMGLGINGNEAGRQIHVSYVHAGAQLAAFLISHAHEYADARTNNGIWYTRLTFVEGRRGGLYTGAGRIYLSPPSANRDNYGDPVQVGPYEFAIVHEYGHLVHDSIALLPERFESDPDVQAFIEGWANYFSNLITSQLRDVDDAGGWGGTDGPAWNDYRWAGNIATREAITNLDVITKVLWDLADNTPGEPGDETVEPDQVFGTMNTEMGEPDDCQILCNLRQTEAPGYNISRFIGHYRGTKQTAANLASHWGIWPEGGEERFGPGRFDIWNDLYNRATPTAPDEEGLLTYSVSGKIQRLQSDIFRLELTPEQINAFRAHALSVRVDVNEMDLDGEEEPVTLSVLRGESDDEGHLVDAVDDEFEVDTSRGAYTQVLHLERHESDAIFVKIKSPDWGTYGNYNFSVTLYDSDQTGAPRLTAQIDGGPPLAEGQRTLIAPNGRYLITAERAPLPEYRNPNARYFLRVEEYSSPEFSRARSNLRNSWVLENNVFQRNVQNERGRHYYYRARVCNAGTNDCSIWSEPLLVRTYGLPPTPQNLRFFDDREPEEEGAGVFAEEQQLQRLREAAERGNAAEMEEIIFEEAMGAEGVDGDNDGRIVLTFTDPSPPPFNAHEQRGYDIEMAAEGFPFTTLEQNAPYHIFPIGPLPYGTYQVRVRARNGVGVSDYSNVLVIRSFVLPPISLHTTYNVVTGLPELNWESLGKDYRPEFNVGTIDIPTLQAKIGKVPSAWARRADPESFRKNEAAFKEQFDRSFEATPRPSSYKIEEFELTKNKSFQQIRSFTAQNNSLILEQRKPGTYWFRVCELRNQAQKNCSVITKVE